MNVFELGMIAAPSAGLVAGAISATGHSTGTKAACALGGLMIGAAAYLVPVLTSGYLFSRVHDPAAPSDKPGAVEWIAGTVVVLLAALSPFVAWLLPNIVVARLL